MSLDLDSPGLAAALDRAHPYLRTLCAAAGARALEVHADEVTLEHLLDACMRDEDCAAHELVVHAFADPETVAVELSALSPGMMVVGSEGALPFSTRAVRALQAARDAAVAAGADEVSCGLVLREADAELDEPLGLTTAALGPAPGGGGVSPDGPLFRGFSGDAKRALSQASRTAGTAREPSISPARLALACLATAPDLGAAAGVSASAARERLRGRTLDPTPPPPRALPPAEALLEALAALPPGADSLGLWTTVRARADESLAVLLDRHKITPSLLERAAGAFADPATD